MTHRSTEPQGPRFREWPLTVVAVGIVAGLAYMGMNHFKRGSIVIAAFVCLAAVLRLVLPQRQLGLLAVRGRVVDVLVLLTLGVTIAVVTVFVPPPS